MRTWTVFVVSTLPAVSTLEKVSVWSPSVVTGTLRPAPFGAVVGAPRSVGKVLSMLIAATVAEAVFPARSVAVPPADWFAPSPVSVVFPTQLWRPDATGGVPAFGSAQVKVTATLVL